VILEGLSEHYVESFEELMEIYEAGLQNRQVGRTNINAVSSRSHLITILYLKQTDLEKNLIKESKCQLIDLAGSEKVSKTGATGITLEEGKLINQSLLWLGNVINSLVENQGFIPYRNSKLT
jgi:kinesin family protein 5